MSVSYSNLWKLLIDKNMKKTDLIKTCNISSNIVAKMGKNQYVSMETIDKICQHFECRVEDIMEIMIEK